MPAPASTTSHVASPTSIPTAPSQSRLACLDGIRGWASLMVVLSHGLQCFLLSSTPQYDKPYNRFISDGSLAVFVFFVLSGFALTIKFVKNEEDSSLVATAMARYFRLTIPIFGASLIVFLMIAAGMMINLRVGPMANSAWLSSFYQFPSTFRHLLNFSFYRSLFNFDGRTAYIEALWTMPIEFSGSMIVFVIVGIFVLRRPKGQVSLIPLGLLAMYVYQGYSTLGSFIVGYYLAELYQSRVRSWKWVQWLATIAIVVPVYFSTYHRPQDNFPTLLLATLIVFAGVFSPPLNRLFSTAVSRFMGRISFPLYLIHVPLLCSFGAYLYLELTSLKVTGLMRANLVLGTFVAVSILAATALLPMEKLSVRWSGAIGRGMARYLRFSR